MRRKQGGFTLIEIAIVLVIIGLLLGGVLKGQELITSARVRNLISQQDGVKAAYFGFLDRYRALPGDYSAAKANINGASTDGNGNGQIEASATVSSGTVEEEILVWEHLSHAGFMTGAYKFAATYTPASGVPNPYGSYLVMRFDGKYSDPASPVPTRHNLKTGAQVPADLLAEIDRKVDDGNPSAGAFRASDHNATGTAPTMGNCIVAASGSGTSATPATWKITGGSVEPNCAGATLF
jgi:prepilin-type N-terminal cleavage/methylation domain-containing protein